MANQFQMLDALVDSLKPSASMRMQYAALRNGVDATQNPIERGGLGDGSIGPETWTAARDLALAFEALCAAWDRLNYERIPF